MSTRLSKFCAGLALAGVLVASGHAAPPATKTLPGHVPAVAARLQSTGDLSGSTQLRLAIGLPLRNQAVLDHLLQDIYDPSSPIYHHYRTPSQFAAQFGPTEEDYQKVIAFAHQHGLTVTNTYSNRVLLDVTGTAADIEKAFNVHLRTYHHPTENRDFFAPDTDPTVDASLPILHISGLDNAGVLRKFIEPRPSGLRAAVATPNAGSAPGGAYQGSDFRNAYVPGSSLTGTGQNVGLLEFDGFYPSDVTAYETQIGLVNPPQVVAVPVDGGTPVPTPFGNPEVSLDIDMVLAMSPGVSTIYVYEGPSSSFTSFYTLFEDILNRMVNDDSSKQLSSSWGLFGGPDPVAELIFEQMAVQGQTFFQASGDDDAYTGFIPFPSDSPHITLVGGTTLTTGTAASYTSETVWNWDIEFGPAYDGIGSSGGISPNYSIPSWQTNINATLSKGSTTMRNVPDVALTADNVWVDYGDGENGVFGGTSCAAPLWAAFTALVNQQAVGMGNAPVGFINPALYTIAGGPNYTSCFHDITTGNNTWSGSPNLFYAVTGYDLCTGLGTPNGTAMINALASSVNPVLHLSPPPAPYGTNLAALNGGNPNGNWYIFIQDDSAIDSGMVSNGWVLTLTSANPVGSAADNQLLMTSSATNIPLNGAVAVYLTVTNYGPSIATNVLVSDTMPQGFDLTSSSASIGSVNRSGSTVLWTVGNLANNIGGSASLTLQASTNVAAGNYVNSAVVSASTPDPNPADGSPFITITVGTAPQPQIAGLLVNNNKAIQLTFSYPSGQAGETNIVLASTNLLSWVPIFTNLGTSLTYTDLFTPGYPARFYRTLILPP